MFFLLVSIFIVSVSAEYFAESASRPNYVIVSSRQRSSSTTLTSVLGSHPCMVSGNEIFVNDPVQDRLGAHSFVNMTYEEIREFPDLFLSKAHSNICKNQYLPPVCQGHCTVSVKLFDEHSITYPGIQSLMENDDNFFLVLERDVHDEYCSFKKAKETGDWGVTPQGHNKQLKFECPDYVDLDFKFRHKRWFNMLRSKLHEAGRFFIEVPFSLVASCRLHNLVNSIFMATGQPLSNIALELKGTKFFMNGEMENLFKNCQ